MLILILLKALNSIISKQFDNLADPNEEAVRKEKLNAKLENPHAELKAILQEAIDKVKRYT